MNIELGKRYKDVISGFKGVATGHATYLSGCHQTLLTPKGTKKDGSRMEADWFDDQRLVECGTKNIIIKLNNTVTPGPDKPAPKNPI